MYTGEEEVGSTDNSRIARSKMFDKAFIIERVGIGVNATYIIKWRDGKAAGVHFLVTRKSAAKKILGLRKQGYYRIL